MSLGGEQVRQEVGQVADLLDMMSNPRPQPARRKYPLGRDPVEQQAASERLVAELHPGHVSNAARRELERVLDSYDIAAQGPALVHGTHLGDFDDRDPEVDQPVDVALRRLDDTQPRPAPHRVVGPTEHLITDVVTRVPHQIAGIDAAGVLHRPGHVPVPPRQHLRRHSLEQPMPDGHRPRGHRDRSGRRRTERPQIGRGGGRRTALIARPPWRAIVPPFAPPRAFVYPARTNGRGRTPQRPQPSTTPRGGRTGLA